MATATLRPFFSYYGGKWRAAPHYPAPRHPTLIEPFAGSAGYALRYPDRDVRLFDVDPIICGVWDYIIKASASEVLSLPLDFDCVDDLAVPQEARWLIGFWINKGTARPLARPSKWMRDGLQPSQFWGEQIRARVATQAVHIRHWRVTNASYEQAGDAEATWFIDPPYQARCGRQYTHNRVDFPGLGVWCRSRRGQVIVCEESTADWLPFRPLGVFKATEGAKRKKVTHEAIWTGDAEALAA
jgi:hypothetical protein